MTPQQAVEEEKEREASIRDEAKIGGMTRKERAIVAAQLAARQRARERKAERQARRDALEYQMISERYRDVQQMDYRNSNLFAPPSASVQTRHRGSYAYNGNYSNGYSNTTLTADMVPGRPGIVQSPYAPDQGYVDVRGLASGTQVRDPYTGRIFIVP